MAITQEKTPFYIRMEDGSCFYVDTLEEALTHFVNTGGYRLTLTSGDNEVVVRRHTKRFDSPISATTYEAAVEFRKTRKE